MLTRRFVDLQTATEFVLQHGGRIELSEDYEAWLVTQPGHWDAVSPHNPLVPVEDCAECRRLGWITVPDIEPAQEAAR